MHSRWAKLFCETILLLGCLATGFPLETTPGVGDGSNTTGLTLDNSGPHYLDDRFSVSFESGHDPISSLSTHVNSILFLCFQALLDFEGSISAPSEVSQEPWNDMQITGAPSPQPSCTRKLLVWALYEGLVHFKSSPFVNTGLYFRYDNTPQGFVFYDIPATKESTTITVPVNGTGSAQVANTPSLLANSLNNLLVQASRRVTVQVTYAPRARVLQHSGLFLPMAGALQMLASSDGETPARPFQHNNDPSRNFFRLQLLQTSQPQRFTVSNAISAIWETTRQVATTGVFKELTATVKIDRWTVAAITIGKNSETDLVQTS